MLAKLDWPRGPCDYRRNDAEADAVQVCACEWSLHACGRPCPLTETNSARYQGHIGAALVLGGYDLNGPQLYTIAPHGSTDKLPYVTMGSGSLAAMAIFEAEYKKDMDVRRRL